jgi:polysaccharide pyruvyl transferase WcaK-like protein
MAVREKNLKLGKTARRIRDSRFYGAVVGSRPYYWAHSLSDAVAFRLGNVRRPGGDPQQIGHIVFAPNGSGNIGDQALFEAYLAQVQGDVLVLCNSPEALIIPPADVERVTLESIVGFTYAPPVFRFAAAYRLASLVGRARSLSVVGADLMDGAYNPGASLARCSALWMAAKLGQNSTLLGCSWADAYNHSCARAMQRAGRAGAKLNFRDSVSQQRAINAGIEDARLTADIVFSDEHTDDINPLQSFVDHARRQGRSIALVNASGLIGKRISQERPYATIVRDLLDRGMNVILLPHVFRATGDDLAELARIFSQFDDDRVELIERPLRPSTVRRLCADSDLVITGRMHLAVMALSKGVIPITLGTHGKVEGLYRHFKGIDYCVQPTAGFESKVIELVPEALTQDRTWTESLALVKSLALENFDQSHAGVASGPLK